MTWNAKKVESDKRRYRSVQDQTRFKKERIKPRRSEIEQMQERAADYKKRVGPTPERDYRCKRPTRLNHTLSKTQEDLKLCLNDRNATKLELESLKMPIKAIKKSTARWVSCLMLPTPTPSPTLLLMKETPTFPPSVNLWTVI